LANFEGMREKHRRDSMLTFSVMLFFLLVFIFHNYFIIIFSELRANPDDLLEILKDTWLIIILPIMGPVAFYILGVITIAKRDLYYLIDNIFFKRRKTINKHICQQMLNFRIKLTEEDKKSIEELSSVIEKPIISRHIMSLFYIYIENNNIVNPELKSQAFIYWGDYFSSMMFIFWSSLTFLGSLVTIILNGHISVLRLVILFIISLLFVINLHGIIWGKTANKLIEIPEAQIREIHRNASKKLLNDLRAERFFLDNA